MSRNLGNLTEDQAIHFKFNTTTAAGAPVTLSGTPSLIVYRGNGTTESTAGVTLTVDFDSVTGLHHVAIDASADAFYAVGYDYQVVVAAGTVDGVSVVGTVLAEFSIENRYMEADVVEVLGTAVPAPGTPEVDVVAINGFTTIDGLSVAKLFAVLAAALAGKSSGSEANAPVHRNLADSLNRIAATVDASGNRTAVTLTTTDLD